MTIAGMVTARANHLNLETTDTKVQNHDSGCPDIKTSQADHIVPRSGFMTIEGATVGTSDHSPTPSPIPSDAPDTIDSSG